MKFPALISISIFLISYGFFSSASQYGKQLGSSKYSSRGILVNDAEKLITSSRPPEDKQQQLFQFQEIKICCCKIESRLRLAVSKSKDDNGSGRCGASIQFCNDGFQPVVA